MEDWVLEKIRRAKQEHWRFLELSHVGLDDLPEEVFDLVDLEGFVAGDVWCDMALLYASYAQWNVSRSDGQRNRLQRLPMHIARLRKLRYLHLGGNPIASAEQLAELRNLTSLNLSHTEIISAEPLAGLTNLTSLNLSHTKITSLRPLAGLTRLANLKLRCTKTASTEPLAGLTNLTSLDLSGTEITSTEPLASLPNLRFLDLGETKIRSVQPLAGLTNLTCLHLHLTEIASVEPLAELTELTTLVLFDTNVRSVEPLAGLRNLTFLSLSHTKVSSVDSLGQLSKLVELDLAGTEITSAQSLTQLTNLRSLVMPNCRLARLPRGLIELPRIEYLVLSNNPIEDCPREVLAHGNCLEAVRAHYSDRDQGATADRELKMILLGNGRVGKTSVVNRLLHNRFDQSELSTHGIRLEAWCPNLADGPARINVWDFGGQDIYHGTHALFLKGRAVFLIVWDRQTEGQIRYCEDGLDFEHFPLQYWLDYVRAVLPGAPVVVVENKCDEGRGGRAPVDLQGLATVSFSAKEGHGRETLRALLQEIFEREMAHDGQFEIGVGRWHVKQTLRALQEQDELRPLAERRYRTITRQRFAQLCTAQQGKVSSADELLRFLHDTGVVYYQAGLFNNQIILDQRWAADAVYTIFHRQKCLRQLRERHGRFKRSTLHDLVWGDEGFTFEEQKLFISFMESCSICFQINWDAEGPEYIAPELLPQRQHLEREIDRWRRAADSSESFHFCYRHRFLHQGVMQQFMVRVGRMFREAALYWKDGLLLESPDRRAGAEIQCRTKMEGDPARGEIAICVWGSGYRALVNQLRNEFDRLHPAHAEIQQLASLDGEDWVDLAKLPDADRIGQVVSQRGQVLDVQPFRFLLHRDTEDRLSAPRSSKGRPMPNRAIYISYACGDDRETGPSREGIVDHLYGSLKADGYDVRRDKMDLGYKGLISQFMADIGRGVCVVVVISDKYLRSPYCMWELLQIYRNLQFHERICPIVLADAKIHSVDDRIEYTEFWRKEKKRVDSRVKKLGIEALSTEGTLREAEKVREISHTVDKLLTFVADMNTLNPDLLAANNFETLKRAIDERLGQMG